MQIEIDGKSSLGYCELPTGIIHDGELLKSVHFREMGGPEEDVFANKKMSVTRKLTTVMQNCVTKFGDIEDRETINKLIGRLTGTDRFYLLIRMRMLSVDPVFQFKTICPECKSEDAVSFDLDGVSIKRAPSADALISDEITLPSSKSVVRLKVAGSREEEIIEKAQNEKNAVSLALACRIDSFNGRPANLSDIISLNMRDRKVLRENIDKMEGELDDEYSATCPKCGHEYKGNLPLGGPDFLGL